MKTQIALTAGLLGALLIGSALTVDTPATAPDDPANARSFPLAAGLGCELLRVVDGDTVAIRCAGPELNARLTGYDTPETFRSGCAGEKALGERATRHLETILQTAGTIVPQLQGADRYKRLLIRLIVDGTPLEDRMIAAGLAVSYTGGKRIDWCRKIAGT